MSQPTRCPRPSARCPRGTAPHSATPTTYTTCLAVPAPWGLRCQCLLAWMPPDGARVNTRPPSISTSRDSTREQRRAPARWAAIQTPRQRAAFQICFILCIQWTARHRATSQTPTGREGQHGFQPMRTMFWVGSVDVRAREPRRPLHENPRSCRHKVDVGTAKRVCIASSFDCTPSRFDYQCHHRRRRCGETWSTTVAASAPVAPSRSRGAPPSGHRSPRHGA